jgi:Outer membrane protein beta-barrel domain
VRRAVFLLLLFAVSAEAQQKPRPEIKATAGWVGFIDENWIDHKIVGASARFYLTTRFGVEPEVLYMVGPGSDRDVTLIPHLSFDFLSREKVRPYIIGGAGLMHHSQKIGPIRFSNNEWVGDGGIGVKLFFTPRLFVAPEFRVGFETIFRVAGVIGFTF